MFHRKQTAPSQYGRHQWNLISSLGLLTVITLAPSTLFADEKTEEPATMTEAETAFQESLNNAVLVGYFTVDDAPDAGNKPERYEIRKISKMNDKTWLFQTRVKYGRVDTVVPIFVPIQWAGDTPMVSMTDFTIPGLGTFSCRVLFDGDRYAGTWQHGPKGGHMWGKIEKMKQQEQPGTKPRSSRSGNP